MTRNTFDIAINHLVDAAKTKKNVIAFIRTADGESYRIWGGEIAMYEYAGNGIKVKKEPSMTIFMEYDNITSISIIE